ncbi:hypothetical protein BJ944DRAFT_238721 [Cunninghamella echinulata]|nr:hypothetical protein BJ944DRAFT_238721 [Cunninghamella echinulata]
MDKLPIEILQHIFSYLSQRNIANIVRVCKHWRDTFQPTFYSTINIYSYQQWEKFIETAKETTIQDQSIIYYVYHLNIYFESKLFFDHIMNIIIALPNIQSIHTLGKYTFSRKYIYASFPELQQLTYIPNWYKYIDNQRMSCYHQHNLISLEYDLQYFSTSPRPTIYLKPIGPIKYTKDHTNYNYFLDSDNDNNIYENRRYQNKIVMLPPTLESLTSLHITFSLFSTVTINYELDERTLETIHCSCPKLETLHLDFFHMNISEQYDSMISAVGNKKFIPAPSLKVFKIMGIILDPRCYTYINLKYTQMEAFDYNLRSNTFVNLTNRDFRSTLFYMLNHSPFLKRLSISLYASYQWNPNYWPRYEFLQWLYDHPQQLTHLYYHDSLFPVTWQQQQVIKENNNGNDNGDENGFDLINIFIQTDYYKRNKMFQHGTFLDYLTTLSLNFIHLVDTVTTFFLLNEHTVIFSNSIKELTIYHDQKYNCLYIYDWLDAFPHLKTLTTWHMNSINDSDGDALGKYMIEDNDNKKNGIYLHRLVQQRKHQLGISNDENKIYPLKKLDCQYGHLHLNYGLDLFFKKFNQLRHIAFSNVSYTLPVQENDGDDDNNSNNNNRVIHVNLSHLYLDFFSISFLHTITWVEINQQPEKKSKGVVNKLIVNECLSSKIYTLDAIDTSSIIYITGNLLL